MNRITKTMTLVAISLLGLFGCNSKTSNGLLVYDFRGKYGYMDRKGNVVIEPQFDDAEQFSEGLACVKIGDKTGYINKTGAFVIDGEGLEFVGKMSDGMVMVGNKGKYGYFDKNGNQVLAFKYESASDYSDGLAWVVINGDICCIDKRGNVVIDAANYIGVNDFNEGMAFVWIDYEHPVCIDKKGNVVIDKLPEGLSWDDDLMFSEGLARVKIDDKYGYIDRTGKIVIEPKYDEAEQFSDGLALILNENNRYGYIDKTGRVVIQPKYNLASSFSEGLAAVCCFRDGSLKSRKYYYIDKNEKMVIDSLFCKATEFHDGIAKVIIYNEGDNYVDKKGNLLINRNVSYFEKLFSWGARDRYSIRDYLLDNDYHEALIEKYGKKWYDVLKNQEWDNSQGRTYYNEEDRCYTCVDNTIDEEMIGFMRYYPEKDEVSSALFVLEIPGVYDLEHAIRVMPDGKVQCGNWKEDYFVNEFNEKDYNYPYVYISLPGVYTPENWDVNIRIMFSKEGFRIVQEEDITWDTDIVIRRDSDGQTLRVPYKEYGAGGIVSDYDYCEWISDVLNEGNFTIKVGSTISRVTNETKGFKGAVINLHGGFFSPTQNNASSSPEFHQQVNSGVSQFVVIEGSQLRLRLGPSTSSDTFKWPDGTNRHPNVGDKFRYLGESDDFYKIDFNGNELWVSKQYTHLE